MFFSNGNLYEIILTDFYDMYNSAWKYLSVLKNLNINRNSQNIALLLIHNNFFIQNVSTYIGRWLWASYTPCLNVNYHSISLV